MTPMLNAGAATLLLLSTIVSAAPSADAGQRRDGAPATSNSGLRAHVYPRMSRAPALIRIQVLVEPADGNRALQFVIESESYYRSSTITLSGAKEPRLHTVEFRFVPAGTHDIRVAVIDGGGTVRAVVTDRVAILE
jgi:hypothetical protein